MSWPCLCIRDTNGLRGRLPGVPGNVRRLLLIVAQVGHLYLVADVLAVDVAGELVVGLGLVTVDRRDHVTCSRALHSPQARLGSSRSRVDRSEHDTLLDLESVSLGQRGREVGQLHAQL